MNRLITAVLATFATLTLSAQTPAIAPPVLPLIAHYTYWPVQFVQFVGDELPYSMIELDVDSTSSKHPLLYVTLTDRATGKRIHYSDNDALIASATAQGDEAHKTSIAYEGADAEAVGAATTVRFTMANEKPLQWRFVQGSDISEQGSGLNPFPTSKIPIFAYRELGSLAGEGTALQIGDTVSTAAVWTEYSHPPYFVPYRGAETQSAHLLLFTPGHENWKITTSPAALTAGATWELDEEHGNHRSIHIDKVDGTHITVTSTDRSQADVHCTLDATRDGDTWKINQVRFSPIHDGEKHALTLQFATPLSTAADTTQLTLLTGKKKSIATGGVAATGDSSTHTLTLSFGNPAWLAGKTITEQETVADQNIVLTAHP